jgi:hypothetical protein
MSMELWQRLKDLEKKVQEHSDRLKALETDAPWTTPLAAPQVSLESAFQGKTLKQTNAELLEDFKKLEELELRTPPAAVIRKPGPALCPKCGRVPGYHYHVKYCKGNVEVA